MTVDIQESLITEFYNLLTGDATLQGLVGGTVRLYHVWAADDASFPYLVHRIELRSIGAFNIEPEGTYLIDIWSYSPSSEEALDIKQRLMTLLNNRAAATSETTSYRIWWQTDTFVPESTPDVWHLAMQFNLKHLKDDEVGVLLNR